VFEELNVSSTVSGVFRACSDLSFQHVVMFYGVMVGEVEVVGGEGTLYWKRSKCPSDVGAEALAEAATFEPLLCMNNCPPETFDVFLAHFFPRCELELE
jgi:hypothetical protein